MNILPIELNYILAFAIGATVGWSELISRYKNRPFNILRYGSSLLYIAINGIISLGVFSALENTESVKQLSNQSDLIKVIITSSSAMAIMRTSLFNFKHNGKDISAGPVIITEIFLNAAIKACDQDQAEIQLKEVSQIMKNLNFKDFEKDLVPICLTALKGVSNEEQKAIGEEVKKLSNNDYSNQAKSIILGQLVIEKNRY